MTSKGKLITLLLLAMTLTAGLVFLRPDQTTLAAPDNSANSTVPAVNDKVVPPASADSTKAPVAQAATQHCPSQILQRQNRLYRLHLPVSSIRPELLRSGHCTGTYSRTIFLTLRTRNKLVASVATPL